MKEEDILGKTIIVVCNLKPVTMRGVKSYAMLLCASAKDGKDEGGIEFVLPPPGTQPGERIYFEGEKFESESSCSARSLSGGPLSSDGEGQNTLYRADPQRPRPRRS